MEFKFKPGDRIVGGAESECKARIIACQNDQHGEGFYKILWLNRSIDNLEQLQLHPTKIIEGFYKKDVRLGGGR